MLNISVSRELDIDVSGGVSRGTKRYLMDAMTYGFNVSQEEVPEDRGTLRRSGVPPEWNGNTIEWKYTAPHSVPMEKGTDPFFPPVEPLLEWSERVSGDEGLGWYTARHKIPTEGIDAQPYAEPGAEATKDWLSRNDYGSYLEDELE